MAAMASKFNFECVIQYYTDQWRGPIDIKGSDRSGTSVIIPILCAAVYCEVKKETTRGKGKTIEILDLECVLCHVTGVQNENKNALINPPSWIFPRSVVYKMSWGEFNLPL